MKTSEDWLNINSFDAQTLEAMLKLRGEEANALHTAARECTQQFLGQHVFLRGLIELNNACRKDCLYCGIRKSNDDIKRYIISDEEVLAATEFALENGLGSLVIQGGELNSEAWTSRITSLLEKINHLTGASLGITLSLGEQNAETYQSWLDAGAHRYLLRFETSDPKLYASIHPDNDLHRYDERFAKIELLRNIGFQTGTGVMIGLPGQSYKSLVNDLITMQTIDIDMCGMGPYIEHHNTPLAKIDDQWLSIKERFDVSLNMVAALRLMMKDINIAATTAMETIDEDGRIKAFRAGANVVMPNITPSAYLDSYLLYDNKAGADNHRDKALSIILQDIALAGCEAGLGLPGHPLHFFRKQND